MLQSIKISWFVNHRHYFRNLTQKHEQNPQILGQQPLTCLWVLANKNT